MHDLPCRQLMRQPARLTLQTSGRLCPIMIRACCNLAKSPCSMNELRLLTALLALATLLIVVMFPLLR